MGEYIDCEGNVLNPTEKVTHPEGYIRLSDDTLIETYPRSDTENRISDTAEDQIDMFAKNAFLFLRHSKEILADSRMFLAPVRVSNGLAYTGRSGFRNATLGVYLEWWHQCEWSMREKDNEKWLVWRLSGSPLTGGNCCGMVNPAGDIRWGTLTAFRNLWTSFVRINTRYDSVKSKYEAYSLEEVVARLTAKDAEFDAGIESLRLDNLYLRHHCTIMRERYENERKYAHSLRKELVDTYISYNEDMIRKLLIQHQEIEVFNRSRSARLRTLLKRWKERLKRGEITNVEYQKTISPLKKELKEVKFSSYSFEHDIKWNLPHNITLSEIQAYFAERE